MSTYNMITKFRGKYKFLSNMYLCPINIDGSNGGKLQGVTYPSVENYYQAAKTNNIEEKELIAAVDPYASKRLGRKVKLREDWNEVKQSVMMMGLLHKFGIPELKGKLLLTGYETIVEGNTWHDNYWGDCSCIGCKFIKGQNKLGDMLMAIREFYRMFYPDRPIVKL